MLRCPICNGNCAYGLYIHQFDAANDDCCYFSCVTCISKLRTKVGVPASEWERWNDSDIARHSERSWHPCAQKTIAIMEKTSKKKRKRTVNKKKTEPTAADTDLNVGELIEKVYLHVSTIEATVRAIKRILVDYTSEDS